MNRANRPAAVVAGLGAALAVLTGCSSTVDGTAIRAGAADRNNNSEREYPNLARECDQLDSTTLAETVGSDPADIASTFVGAVCRWQTLTQRGQLIDITRFWFEEGDIELERTTAEELGYAVENRAVSGIRSIVMRPDDPNGACGVASDAQGVVGWWINPQAPGIDACGQAIRLMELTLQTTS